jgi:hypothetical protein
MKSRPRATKFTRRGGPAVADLVPVNLMRTRHLIVLLVLVFVYTAFAAERCQQISDVVAQAAAMKPKLLEQLKKDPQKGTLGEPWRWFAFTLGGDLDKLHVPQAEQQYIFKTVATLHFSSKAEVDFDIFREYFYHRCKRKERGLSTRPLASIPAASLTHCWDTVASRPQFQACMEKLLDSH